MSPGVSIIVPNFNHAKYLHQRLDSIFKQTFQDFEVILLDDCSTDNSLEILDIFSKHPRVSHFIVNKKNNGSPFKQWEKGIELSKGEFIWIAESDDICERDFLAKVLPHLEQNTNVGVAYCQSWSIDEKGNKTGNWLTHTEDFNTSLFNSDFKYKGSDFVNEFLIHKNVIPNTSAVIFRKSIYDQSGGVNSKIKYCGDWYLWLKLAMLSDIYFVSESLNYFRRHENSVIHRALNTGFSDKFYLQNSDKKMREYFSSWLKERHSDFNSIIGKNNSYIDNVIREEAFYYIYEGSFFKSVIYSLKYFRLKRDFKILTVPFTRLPFIMYRFLKKRIEEFKIA